MGIPIVAPYVEKPKDSNLGAFIIRYFALTDKDGTFTHSNGDGSECPIYGYIIMHDKEPLKMLYITDTEFVKWRFSNMNTLLIGIDYMDKYLENEQKIEHINDVFDALGLGIFVVMGVKVAFEQGYENNALISISCGALTCICGGMLRDVLTNSTPFVLVKRIYALAAIAGALLCSSYPILSPTTGAMPGIKAFTAAVFGGIGSIPGAMIGGILLGLIENLSKVYISTQLSDAIVFGILIIILLVKPTGILGKKISEKV